MIPQVASVELLLRAPLEPLDECLSLELVADTAAATEPMVALGTTASTLPFIDRASSLSVANPTDGVS